MAVVPVDDAVAAAEEDSPKESWEENVDGAPDIEVGTAVPDAVEYAKFTDDATEMIEDAEDAESADGAENAEDAEDAKDAEALDKACVVEVDESPTANSSALFCCSVSKSVSARAEPTIENRNNNNILVIV